MQIVCEYEWLAIAFILLIVIGLLIDWDRDQIVWKVRSALLNTPLDITVLFDLR